MFEDQGWEYVNSTFNGWHYFKKEYDPQLPETEYIVYSDESSLKEMRNRWVNFAIMIQIIIMLVSVFYVVVGGLVLKHLRLNPLTFVIVIVYLLICSSLLLKDEITPRKVQILNIFSAIISIVALAVCVITICFS